MKITVFGLGYVGCVTGYGFCGGNNVIAVDPDEKKIKAVKRGESPIGTLHDRRLNVTTNIAAALKNSDECDRYVRALTKPYPGAFFQRGDQKLIIWKSEVK